MECPACDLCGATDALVLYSGAGWQRSLPPIALVRCRRCGLMYLNPRPAPDEIAAYYPPNYAAFRPAIEDERFALMRYMRRRKLAQRRRLVERYSQRRTGRILDVGCATGLFLHEMALAGWQTTGVELTTPAADYARTRFGLDVFNGTLADLPAAPGSFDAVTFFDVLEHVFSPSAELARAAAVLKPGGMVAINVPNWHSFDRRLFGPFWSGLDPPRHLYDFTRPTLTALLERAGLRPEAWVCCMPSYFSFIISVELWLEQRAPKLAGPVGRVLNIPGARLIFEPWFTLTNWLRFSGTITVVAVKT
jgi:SAM-dependent methyltransferase